jgi:hypothetical protein
MDALCMCVDAYEVLLQLDQTFVQGGRKLLLNPFYCCTKVLHIAQQQPSPGMPHSATTPVW